MKHMTLFVVFNVSEYYHSTKQTFGKCVMLKVDTRSEIIQHSRDLFEAQGYSATTMRQIAERTGCTAGSLYYFFAGGKVEILREVVRSYGLDPADRLFWVIDQPSLDALVDRLIIELPQYFREVVKSLVWLQLNPAQLDSSEFSMLRRFPLALFETIYQGVARHLDEPKLCRQVTWSIFSALYGYVDLFNKIGSVVDEPFELEEMGDCVKTAVSALVQQHEAQRKENEYVR